MLVTTVDQSRRGTFDWPLRSSCDKHHARTETRGTQGRFAARHFGLHDLRTDLRSYLADRADLGDSTDDLDGSGDGAAIGPVLWSQQDFIFSQCTPTTGSQLQLLSGTTLEF